VGVAKHSSVMAWFSYALPFVLQVIRRSHGRGAGVNAGRADWPRGHWAILGRLGVMGHGRDSADVQVI
jgi:hypothetical protein